MDPCLEHPRAWPNIHHRLSTAIADARAPKLLHKYQVLVEERVYQVDGQDSILVGAPDVSGSGLRCLVQWPLYQAPADGVTVKLNVPETVRQGHLEIREIATSQVSRRWRCCHRPTNDWAEDGWSTRQSGRR